MLINVKHKYVQQEKFHTVLGKNYAIVENVYTIYKGTYVVLANCGIYS